MRWDDIVILVAIDRLQEERGGNELRIDGCELMNDIAGRPVREDQHCRGFVRELLNLHEAGYLKFNVDNYASWDHEAAPFQWLQKVRRFALTTAGQDRARGRVIVQPLPNPEEDDDRLVPTLILQHVAAAIESQYREEQIPVFLRDSDVPLDRIPRAADIADHDVYGLLVALDQWGSEGRRTLRCFLGSWLDDRLISGPDNELRATLIEQLARVGWYVKDDRLVIGDRAAGRRATSPVLRDARIAALHESIAAVASKYLQTGHPASAVFEALKAVTNRIKQMTGLDVDGVKLIGDAFGGLAPRLELADRSTETGRNIHEGAQFLFRGAVQAIRNPPAHEQLDDMDDNDAFERLNLASLLMRSLDQAKTTSRA